MSRGTAVHVRSVAGILKLPHIHVYVNVNHGAHACVALAGDDGHREQDGQCRSCGVRMRGQCWLVCWGNR